MNNSSKSKYKKYIFHSENCPLSSTPFHSDSKDIERFFSRSFPVHLAVYKIDNAKIEKRKYVKENNHPAPEINILLGNIKYKIILGDEEYIVKAPANIWIPVGLNHSAELIQGEGYFVCLILDNKYWVNGK